MTQILLIQILITPKNTFAVTSTLVLDLSTGHLILAKWTYNINHCIPPDINLITTHSSLNYNWSLNKDNNKVIWLASMIQLSRIQPNPFFRRGWKVLGWCHSSSCSLTTLKLIIVISKGIRKRKKKQIWFHMPAQQAYLSKIKNKY